MNGFTCSASLLKTHVLSVKCFVHSILSWCWNLCECVQCPSNMKSKSFWKKDYRKTSTQGIYAFKSLLTRVICKVVSFFDVHLKGKKCIFVVNFLLKMNKRKTWKSKKKNNGVYHSDCWCKERHIIELDTNRCSWNFYTGRIFFALIRKKRRKIIKMLFYMHQTEVTIRSIIWLNCIIIQIHILT